jgi:hypothetical protein
LAGQLFGHGSALGLVSLVSKVAEGLGPHIKADADLLRLFLLQQLEQHIDKPIYGVGIQSVLVGQQPHCVKGPVNQAVAVDGHQFHSRSPFLKAKLRLFVFLLIIFVFGLKCKMSGEDCFKSFSAKPNFPLFLQQGDRLQRGRRSPEFDNSCAP